MDLTKAQLEKDSLLKVLTQPNSANLSQGSPVHLRSPECVALGGESIWDKAVWLTISWSLDYKLMVKGKVVLVPLKDSRTAVGSYFYCSDVCG